MTKSKKAARNISVNNIAYHWRATGDDGYINFTIWPQDLPGTTIHGNFSYHDTYNSHGDGSSKSQGDQIVITNRLIRKIILYCLEKEGYDPSQKQKQLNLKNCDQKIDWSEAIRAR